MGNTTGCAVDGCMKPLKRAGYCYGHYMKNWRYGTPTPEHVPWHDDLRGQRFGRLTVVEYVGSGLWSCRCDCGRERQVKAGELHRTGDAATCGDRREHSRDRWQDAVGYWGALRRVSSAHGSASNHSCVDCGGTAAQWSYNHSDPTELIDNMLEYPMTYSIDPDHYSARCTACARKLRLRLGSSAARSRDRRAAARFIISDERRAAIYERDNWTCQLCGLPVDCEVDHLHRLAPTLDHIEPQSLTLIPDHSEYNLRTAHRGCNGARGNRVTELDLLQVREARRAELSSR